MGHLLNAEGPEAARARAQKGNRYGKEYKVSRSDIGKHAPVDLTDGYHARVDRRGGEIHLYKYSDGRLREIGIYQDRYGYVKKHGITAGPPTLPRSVENRFKSLQVQMLREIYPNNYKKGTFNLKGLNTSNLLRAGKVLGIYGTINMLNSHHRACVLQPGFEGC